MNFPSRLKIGGKNYKVNYVNDNVVDGTTVCYGNISFDLCHINISTLYHEDHQLCTLMHEVIHGIDDYIGIGLTEEQTMKLSKGLLGFIRENNLVGGVEHEEKPF